MLITVSIINAQQRYIFIHEYLIIITEKIKIYNIIIVFLIIIGFIAVMLIIIQSAHHRIKVHKMSYALTSTDLAVLQFITNQNANRPSNSADPFTPAQDVNGIDTLTSDNVVGFSSIAAGASAITLGSGYNTIILEGAHSTTAASNGASDSFSFSVDQTGLLTVLDNNSGQSETITGASFLIFNDAATGTDANGNAEYTSMYFIGNANQTEVTELYNAAFGRQPDLGGVEYYGKQLKSGMTFTQIATEFMASPEFQARYGADVTDTQFVNNLYQNVLHRTPAASEVAYYTAALANQEAGAIVNTTNPVQWTRQVELLNFTNSPENQADVSGFVVNTSQNGYADPTARIADTSVLTEAATTNYVNTALINPSTITGTIFTEPNGVTSTTYSTDDVLSLQPAMGVEPTTINLAGNNITAVLSSSVNGASILAAGDTVNGYSGGGSIISIWNGGGTVYLYGNNNQVGYVRDGDITFTAPAVINGFNATDSFFFGSGGTNSGTNIIFLSGNIMGSTYFTGSVNANLYVMNVGNVGGGSAAEVAAAANKVYKVADATSEGLIFYGATTSGGTALYDWHAEIANGTVPSADSNSNHQVDVSEFMSGMILVGVTPSTITAAMFH